MLVKLDLFTDLVNDDILLYTQICENLKVLNLTECNEITDQALLYMIKLTKLEVLNLKWIQITDEGLRHLSALTQL